MTREAWLENRRKGIGGSDAAAVMGMSPWTSAVDLYLDKTGQSDPVSETDAMRWGTILEPIIVQEYSNRTGREVKRFDKAFRHPEHEWCLANLDGIADGTRIVEAKTARSDDDWGPSFSDEIPKQYFCQIQHYMAVTGATVTDVAVLIGANDFRIYEIDRDQKFIDKMIEAERVFWFDHVIAGVPPVAETSEAANRLWFHSVKGKEVDAESDLVPIIDGLRDLKKHAKNIETEISRHEALIKSEMQDAEVLIGLDGKPLVTWKEAKAAKRFDAKKFAETHKDLHTQFMVEGVPQRRFLVKKG